jgi:YVTN family beta-propeller protein
LSKKSYLRSFTVLCFLLGGSPCVAATSTFGTVIPISGGTPSDVVIDQIRGLLYLVNTTGNNVQVLNTATNTVVNTITVGAGPLAAAMSMDGNWLYVTNGIGLSVSVINLNTQAQTQVVSLPAAPQGVEVGGDGRALITTAGTGTAALPANTLLIFDQTQAAASQLTAVVTPPPPSTPVPLTPQTLATPTTKFYSKLMRTPSGQYIVGIFSPTASTTYMFVYEVSSGTILRNRTVAGQSTVLSMSPDGSRFMAGYTLYDINTLNALGQMNNANAPFPLTVTFSNVLNTGGSVFSTDGKTLYAAFNQSTATATPLPPTNATTLLVADPTNLAISLGINLPESIVAKMVMSSDGTNAWSLSASGLIYLPISKLYSYPILAPSATQVFLSQNPCNPGLVQQTVNMNNLGAGKLTFAVTTTSPTLISAVSSGVAPSKITFTMEPGRVTTYTRQPGTNLVSGTGATLNGQSLDIAVVSPEAINIPPTIRVYMNYRNPDQRGQIFPLPVTPNNSPNFTTVNTTAANVAGDQGLEDIVLDQARNRVYISNAGYNRIEIFDTVNQVFLTPIPVNQMPHQLALSSDDSTLYVASNGGETIDMVNLAAGKDIGHISFPAIPRQAGGQTEALVYPQAMALGNEGLEFVMSNGGQWKVIAGAAIPRPADTVTKTASGSSTLSTPVYMLASGDGSNILTLTNNGIAYLYQASTDSYISSNTLFSTFQSYYGPLAAGPSQSWFALGGLFTNGSLTQLGGAQIPSQQTGAQRNVAALAPFDASNYVRASTPVRTTVATVPTTDARETIELVNIASGTTKLLAVAPDNPRFTVLGTTRYNLPPRSMVIDSNNVAYIIGLSGLSVVPLTPNGAPTPAISTAAKNITVASTGSTTLTVGATINISGTNLASTATASTLPAPTVLGGSCVTFNDVPLTLLSTSASQIQAQIPTAVTAGNNVVQVRSLATGLESATVIVPVTAPGGGSGAATGSTAINSGAGKTKTEPQAVKQ